MRGYNSRLQDIKLIGQVADRLKKLERVLNERGQHADREDSLRR